MSAVHEAIEDSIGERGIADVVVPVVDRKLTGDEVERSPTRSSSSSSKSERSRAPIGAIAKSSMTSTWTLAIAAKRLRKLPSA